jgi:hypothetical protein
MSCCTSASTCSRPMKLETGAGRLPRRATRTVPCGGPAEVLVNPAVPPTSLAHQHRPVGATYHSATRQPSSRQLGRRRLATAHLPIVRAFTPNESRTCSGAHAIPNRPRAASCADRGRRPAADRQTRHTGATTRSQLSRTRRSPGGRHEAGRRRSTRAYVRIRPPWPCSASRPMLRMPWRETLQGVHGFRFSGLSSGDSTDRINVSTGMPALAERHRPLAATRCFVLGLPRAGPAGVRVFRPGDAFPTETTTGRGHVLRTAGGGDVLVSIVELADA